MDDITREAVAALSGCEWDTAEALLKSVIQKSVTFRYLKYPGESCAPGSGDPRSKAVPLSTFHLVPVSTGSTLAALRENSQVTPNAFSVYAHAFVQGSDGASHCSIADKSRRTVRASTMIYNLALMYHMKGIHQGQDQCLHRALSLYEMSASLLLGITFSERSHPVEDCAKILILALQNNMGQIYSVFGLPKKAQRCAVHIGKVLRYCHMTSRREGRTEFESIRLADHLKFFSAAVLYLALVGSFSAAAA
jgi:hypothetical protein